MRHHLLIAGTGRAGTSLLVRILDACGLETELSRRGDAVFWDHNANAGIENIPILGDDHPYVVKSPFSYQFIRELLSRPDIQLDGVVIPVRDLDEATASRVVLELRHRYEHLPDFASQVEETWRDWGTVPGGVTYSLEPLDQARILAYSLHRVIEPLVDREVPMHFLKFPRFADDLAYLYRRLQPVLPSEISLGEFSSRVASVIDARKVRITEELRAPRQQPDGPGPTAQERVLHDTVALPTFDQLDQIALKRELRSVAEALRRARNECDGLSSQCIALATDRNDLIAQRDALATARASLEARLALSLAEQAQTRAHLEDVANSTSWKLTAPLRALVVHLRNLKPAASQQGQRCARS